ncbi:bifunctional riboflavin kinase/FAD synthetase [Georgenia wangjunii]|uniref:bifunctional riboflavin kinase/FAD synthetase n=1 Tax=Georgenia wangjunii TaxID=3117730 RepID=UPI002F266D0A
MQVWRGTAEVPEDLERTFVTIGNFDGVHRGHRAVLAELVAEARAAGAPAVVVTFDPHPAQVHRPDEAPPLLTGLVDRLELLAQTGVDAVLVLSYTLDFARATPEEFVLAYLVGALRARGVVIGADTRFGWQNAGDRRTMAELGARHGFTVRVVDDVAGDDAPQRWSSSWVRELLTVGDVAGAAQVLGRPHRIRGVVVHGEARGRELGYPTANLDPAASGAVPADGVYAGWLLRAGTDGVPERLPAAVSIGVNPTFDGVVRQVEAYVLGRTDLELYGEEVVVELVQRLRPTVRFDGVDALVAQMADDTAETARILGVC